MRVKINSNILTVVTDILASTVERGLADLTAYDDKKQPLYAVKVSSEGKGSLSQFGLVSNSIVDGKLAVVIIEDIGFTRDDFIKKYGKGVVAANKFCPIIANAAASEEEVLQAAFAEA